MFRSEEDWVSFVSELPENSAVGLISGENGLPRRYPCVGKIIETVLLDDQENEVQGFFITLFYREDAFELLGLTDSLKNLLDNYQYAESS